MSEQFDLVVIGSGAAGLAAAITAAESGARVIVLEKSPFVGGTTAFSGALLWAPLHGKSVAADPADSREAAIEYIIRNSGACDPQLVEAYVDSAADTIGYFERVTPLRVVNTPYPDTFPEKHGGRARGRHLEPALYPLGSLGPWRARLRQPAMAQTLRNDEMLASGLLRDIRRAIPRVGPRMAWRMLRGRRAGGQALVAALLKGALQHGVEIRLRASVSGLLTGSDGRVIGADCERESLQEQFTAVRGVVLACGGFEWSEADVRRHIHLPLEHPPSPPLAVGDNLRLAAGVQAMMSRLDEIWHWPTGFLPGTCYEGREVGTLILAERTFPHTIIVNRQGRRFADEAAHNFALAMFTRDAAGGFPNVPAWVVFDQQYRSRYPVLFKLMPKTRDPAWLTNAPSLAELAALTGIDVQGLGNTVARFNGFASAGRDDDFDRGGSAYDRYLADSARSPNPCLGTIERPPFYAMRVYPSAVGTRGGPRTTADGQVIDEQLRPIPGLYAAGNAAACFHGTTMVGGGATIMAGLIFGRRAALHALRR